MAEKINANIQGQQSLLANVSHELRTPLTRLQLAMAMLEDKYGEDKYLSRIELEIGHMDALIAEILALSRLQSENQGLVLHSKVNIEAIDLVAFIKERVAGLEIEAKARDIRLSVEELAPLSLHLDQKSFASALDNILRNAVRHAKHSVFLSFKVHEAALFISVEDDGDGLINAQGERVTQSDELEKILAPFYQENKQSRGNKPNDDGGGTGLGLAIANAAMILNNGSLHVSVSSHGGLRFDLQIPIMGAQDPKPKN
jgi:two-component system sensor histidine kinase CpxA